MVGWDAWQKQQQKQASQTPFFVQTTPIYYPGHIDNYNLRPQETSENSKWKISKGQNQFSSHSYNQKEEDEWYEGVSRENKVAYINIYVSESLLFFQYFKISGTTTETNKRKITT